MEKTYSNKARIGDLHKHKMVEISAWYITYLEIRYIANQIEIREFILNKYFILPIRDPDSFLIVLFIALSNFIKY